MKASQTLQDRWSKMSQGVSKFVWSYEQIQHKCEDGFTKKGQKSGYIDINITGGYSIYFCVCLYNIAC